MEAVDRGRLRSEVARLLGIPVLFEALHQDDARGTLTLAQEGTQRASQALVSSAPGACSRPTWRLLPVSHTLTSRSEHTCSV